MLYECLDINRLYLDAKYLLNELLKYLKKKCYYFIND
jgi:hypothetical protein